MPPSPGGVIPFTSTSTSNNNSSMAIVGPMEGVCIARAVLMTLKSLSAVLMEDATASNTGDLHIYQPSYLSLTSKLIYPSYIHTPCSPIHPLPPPFSHTSPSPLFPSLSPLYHPFSLYLPLTSNALFSYLPPQHWKTRRRY